DGRAGRDYERETQGGDASAGGKGVGQGNEQPVLRAAPVAGGSERHRAAQDVARHVLERNLLNADDQHGNRVQSAVGLAKLRLKLTNNSFWLLSRMGED